MAKRKTGRRDNKSGQIIQDGQFFRARLEVGRNAKTGQPQYKTARCKTKAEAVEALSRMVMEFGMGKTAAVDRSNFGQFLEDWLENSIKPNKSPNTYRQYEWLVREHIKPHLGTKQTDKITRADIQRLLTVKAAQKVSARGKEKQREDAPTLSGNTLRLILACLHASYEEAKRQDLTMKNPADNIELPRKARDAKKQFLTSDEVSKVMKTLKLSDLGDFFAFMITTGTRPSEAAGVRMQDLDLTVEGREVVWIRGQLQRVNSQLVYVPGTKTNQDRCLPLVPDVVDRIKGIQAKRLIEGGTKDPDALVFLNAEGKRLDLKHVANRLAEVCTVAGVPVVSPHKLRHTHATLALAGSGDLHGVQKMLGHSQVALTSNLYGHATAETLRSVSSAVERALAPKPRS